MNKKNKLGSLIRELRKDKNMSQAKLAEMIGKSTGSVGQFERGEIFPNYDTLCKLVEIFDIDANLIFSRKGTQFSKEATVLSNLLSQMDDNTRKNIINYNQAMIKALTNEKELEGADST